MKKCVTCGHPSGQSPYYENVEEETLQDHASVFNDTRYAAAVVVREEFQIPAVGSDIQVCLRDVTNVVVGSYLSHPVYGYLKIVYWDSCSKKVGLLNEGLEGTAPAGTVVSECTGFVPSARPCCADQDNFSLFPFLAEDFEAPGVGQTRTIKVTSTFGLVVGTNIRIGDGIYFLNQINSSLEIVITNDGAGTTPGAIVEARDAAGNLQYLITTIIVNACSETTVNEGVVVVCDGSDGKLLEGNAAGDILVLQDSVTSRAAYVNLDLDGNYLRLDGTNESSLAVGAIELDKIVDITTDRLLGRDTAGSGVTEELTVGAGLEFTGSGGIQVTSEFREPTGTVKMYAGAGTPTGYLLCDGTPYNRITYAALFAIIGTAYGIGDGVTTFNVPDVRQRFPLGQAASGTGAVLGSSGGTINHLHTGPAHTHALSSNGQALISYENFTAADNVGYKAATAASYTKDARMLAGSGLDTTAHTAQTAATALAGATDSEGTGNTGTANPPFVTFNFIIKT